MIYDQTDEYAESARDEVRARIPLAVRIRPPQHLLCGGLSNAVLAPTATLFPWFSLPCAGRVRVRHLWVRHCSRRRTQWRIHAVVAIADGQLHAHRVCVREQHLERGARGRPGQAPHKLSGADDESALFAGRPIDRLQRRLRRQRRRVRRGCGRWRTKASDVASGRRRRAGMDAGWQGDHVRVRPRVVGAKRRAAVLDRARRGGRRVANGDSSRLPGQDFAERFAHRVSHEQLVG